MNVCRLALITLSLTLLVACGGGGGGSNSPNTLSASDVWDVLRDRAARADTYLVEAYGTEPNNDGIIEPENGIACSGVNCSYELRFTDSALQVNINPQGQYPNESLPQSTPTLSLDARITSRTENITFFRFSSVSIGGGGMQTFQDYGGWMSNSVFGVTKEIYDYPEDNEEQFPHSEFSAFSFGNSPGTNPTGTGRAEWRGAMIGMRDSNQDIIRGNVSVDIDDFSAGNVNVDIHFTNIRNLDTRAMIDDMTWTDLTLTNGGFSDTNTQTGSIEGTFYGATHDEVGGIFDRNDIIGSFGAAR